MSDWIKELREAEEDARVERADHAETAQRLREVRDRLRKAREERDEVTRQFADATGEFARASMKLEAERDEAREVLRYVRGWLEGADHSFKCPLVSDLYGDDAFCVRCSQIERIDRALANTTKEQNDE